MLSRDRRISLISYAVKMINAIMINDVDLFLPDDFFSTGASGVFLFIIHYYLFTHLLYVFIILCYLFTHLLYLPERNPGRRL